MNLSQAPIQLLPAEKNKKTEANKLPAHLRLPRMEEWQMFDRAALKLLQDEEEAAFLALPEDMQKLAKNKTNINDEEGCRELSNNGLDTSFILLNEDKQREKERLLSQGFTSWEKAHYLAFVKASGAYGRFDFSKIALEVGKTQSDVERISEGEYDRQVRSIVHGEIKLQEVGQGS